MKYFMFMVIALSAAQTQAASVEAERSQNNWFVADSGRHGRLSLNDATDLVQKRTGGRVLAAQEIREQGRALYRIKVLTRQGEVRVVLVDAETGSME